MEHVTFIIKFILLFIGTSTINFLTIVRLLKVKRKWWAKAVLFVITCLISGMIIYISDWGNLPLTFLIFMAGIMVSSEGSLTEKMTIGLMISSTIFSGNAIIDNFLTMHIDGKSEFRLLMAILLYLEIRVFAPVRKSDLSPSMWKLLLLLTATPIGIVLSVILLSEYQTNFMENKNLYFTLLLIALFSFAGLLWTFTMLSKQRSLEQQIMYEEINRKYYDAMKQQHFEIRRLKHDMANHLHTLSALPSDRKDVYIQELLENDAVTKALIYCGDPTVNAVLTVKEEKMKKDNIHFNAKVEIPGELPLNKADVCALFVNALDNAIEACNNISDESRYIILESHWQKGMFVLSMKNPTTNIVVDGNIPITTKLDVKNHGIGLASIQEIVKQQNGNIQIKTEGNLFDLFLYFPV